MIDLDGERLKVQSSMQMDDAAALAEAGARLLPRPEAVIDLSAVSAADSSALAVLLRWQRLQLGARESWRVESAPAGLLSLAKLYGVADTLGIA